MKSLLTQVMYACNNCKSHLVKTRYNCSQCDDFDLCVQCHQKDGHNHSMDKVEVVDFVNTVPGRVDGSSGIGSNESIAIAPIGYVNGASLGGDSNAAGSSATSSGESRRLSIQRCIQSLYHACQCRDINCRRPSCNKMKRVVQHSKRCKRKNFQNVGSKGNACPICKQLIALCCYHAKHCEEAKCSVPYCVNIKTRLKHFNLQKRLDQMQIV